MPRSVWRSRRASVAGGRRLPKRDRNNALLGRSPASRTPTSWCSPANSREGYPAPDVGGPQASRPARARSCEPPLQFGVEVLGFFQEGGDRRGDLRSHPVIVGVAPARTPCPNTPPDRATGSPPA